MKTLQFKNSLTENVFSYSNNYNFSLLKELPLFYKEKERMKPVLFLNEAHKKGLVYASSPTQLGGRVIPTAKLKEILDTSPIPIIINMRPVNYLVGKGFLAKLNTVGTIEPLMVMCYDSYAGIPTNVNQIAMYVSRGIYREEHSKVLTSISQIMKEHPGDVIMTPTIGKYIGSKLQIPKFKTIAEQKKWLNDFTVKTFEKLKKTGIK